MPDPTASPGGPVAVTDSDMAFAAAIGMLAHRLAARNYLDLPEYTRALDDLSKTLSERGRPGVTAAFEMLKLVLETPHKKSDRDGR